MKRDRNLNQAKRGFTLVEALIATAVGAAIIGAGMMIYLQGNRMFFTTTEHASFREEAMLVLENVARDLDQILVNDGTWADDGAYYLCKPFKLTRQYTQEITDPEDPSKSLPYTEAGNGLTFFRYSHTKMVTDANIEEGERPVLVGRKVEYTVEPINASDPKSAVNLLRNGKRINSVPLSAIIFQRMPQSVAVGQVQASPNAVLRVTVIPQGGVWQSMRKDAIDELVKEGTVLSRDFHLSGYESYYTAMLFKAQQKVQGGPGESVLSGFPVLEAVFNDAKDNNGGSPPESVSGQAADGPAQGFELPLNTIEIENVPVEEEVWGLDEKFAGADEVFTPDETGDDLEVPPSVTEDLAGSKGGSEEEQPNHCPAVQNH